MKHLITISCAVVLDLVGCGSDDSATIQAGFGGSTTTSPAGGATAGGTATSAAAGTSSTTTLPQSSFAGKLAINELVPSNHTGAIDEAGAYPDWLELYNLSSSDVSLTGFYLTDSPDEPTKGPLDASLNVKANGVLLLWADNDVDQGILHLPFALSAAGEGLYLFDSEQQLVDSVQWGPANTDAAYARLPDGTGAFAWCGSGTPNRTNGQTCPE